MKRNRFYFLTILTFLVALSAGYWNGWGVRSADDGYLLTDQPHAFAQTADQTTAPKQVEPLPVVGSYNNLKALLEEAEKTRERVYRYRGVKMALETTASAPASSEAQAKQAAPSADSGMAADYSGTNVQVAGVDESDVVKTDGSYLYLVRNQQVVVAQATPADQLKVVSTLNYAEEDLRPSELYVDDNYLVVIGHDAERISKIPYHREQVKAIVYDLRDKTKLKQVKEVALEGHYVSSRKIGSALYLVANRWIDSHWILKEQTQLPAPVYSDSASGDEPIPVDYGDMRYFPDSIEPNYLLIGGINLDRIDQEMQVSSYLGAGENIYASPEHLYVAVTDYELKETFFIEQPPEQKTRFYKFALHDGTTEYLAKGEVPGRILNQFSMDEHDGYFRVATTKGEVWRTDEHTSKNNLYILDDSLALKGKIEDIAPGEKIYSVRFMGDRGYIVTFKKVDPLFVIDLKNPEQPKILGKLKIPGYSDYLHPYDENHLIGFGKDAVEASREGEPGSGSDTIAFYQGMKVALFDVSDVSHPVEKYSLIIGDRGTDSELLHNHKALLFSKAKNLLAFPITVREIPESVKQSKARDVTRYGEFTFQGAYVYQLDLDKGFTLRKKITHLTEQDMLKSGDGWYDSERNVERILYIGDKLYTLSSSMIKAHDLDTYQEVGSLALSD
ncbi:beta-propeller domain-containing protein [Brevibacillus humidisoli]|uniref:beta-propeller domain-containing protein n=1 Tax=Brevibacillus humidisoli TaxID=2895522 RepID=UPI001E38818C|nr:beta-propeller domain-containing protein [Brevibacillus humidisoli]UFJ40254.1 beta-propeller domain-containing protein [Brevibacillus humidisoli]